MNIVVVGLKKSHLCNLKLKHNILKDSKAFNMK